LASTLVDTACNAAWLGVVAGDGAEGAGEGAEAGWQADKTKNKTAPESAGVVRIRIPRVQRERRYSDTLPSQEKILCL
jgi:hypothetical protein